MAIFISFQQINILFELIIEIEATNLSAIKIIIKCFIFHHLPIFENFPFKFLITFELSLSLLFLANITFQSIFNKMCFDSARFRFYCEFSAVLCVVHDTWSLTTINWYAMGVLMWESQPIYFPSKFCFCFLFSLKHKSPNNLNIESTANFYFQLKPICKSLFGLLSQKNKAIQLEIRL